MIENRYRLLIKIEPLYNDGLDARKVLLFKVINDYKRKEFTVYGVRIGSFIGCDMYNPEIKDKVLNAIIEFENEVKRDNAKLYEHIKDDIKYYKKRLEEVKI
ncbi:MAG: hypothetical protein ACTSQS_18310 [Promethearchaeota archaeon]